MAKRIKWTTETFVQKLMSIFGDDFDYSLVEYTGNKNKVFLICKKHGLIYKRAGDLLKGSGCQYCYDDKRGYSKRDSFEEMVKKVEEIHGKNIIIPLQEYKNDKTKIKVICPIHGEFEKTPNSLKNGEGCKLCSNKKLSIRFSDTNEMFKKKVINKYGYEKYDLSKVDMLNRDEFGRITLICHKKNKNGIEHGEFKATPNNVLRGHGCPCCKNSTLEDELWLILHKNKITNEQKKHFDWLGQQHLDFYLPDYNIAIECQGIQHFEPIDFSGNASEKRKIENFHYIINNDLKKRNLCEMYGVKLLYFTSKKINKKNNENFLTKDNIIEQIKNYA